MIPPFQKYLYPFLCLMGDGKIRNISQVSDDLGKSMNLTSRSLLRPMKQVARTVIMAVAVGLAPGF